MFIFTRNKHFPYRIPKQTQWYAAVSLKRREHWFALVTKLKQIKVVAHVCPKNNLKIHWLISAHRRFPKANCSLYCQTEAEIRCYQIQCRPAEEECVTKCSTMQITANSLVQLDKLNKYSGQRSTRIRFSFSVLRFRQEKEPARVCYPCFKKRNFDPTDNVINSSLILYGSLDEHCRDASKGSRWLIVFQVLCEEISLLSKVLGK